MLDNNKCILVYKLSPIEISRTKELGFKVVEVTSDMLDMTVKNILDGYRFKTYKEKPPKEKVVVFNSLSDNELKTIVGEIREIFKGGVLAVVTENTVNWKFESLIDHLQEEKQYYMKYQREN